MLDHTFKFKFKVSKFEIQTQRTSTLREEQQAVCSDAAILKLHKVRAPVKSANCRDAGHGLAESGVDGAACHGVEALQLACRGDIVPPVSYTHLTLPTKA